MEDRRLDRPEYDLLVFVGRFQPVHYGHIAVMKTALEKAKHLLVLVGSSNLSRSTHNPFTFEERRRMVQLGLEIPGWEDQPRVKIEPLDDVYDDDEWVVQVQEKAWAAVGYDPNAKIGLIGHSKDASSYYLKLFPQWGSVDVGNHSDLNSTDIRRVLFSLSPDDRGDAIDMDIFLTSGQGSVPESVGKFIMNFWKSQAYRDLLEEHTFCERYKESWASAPYVPTFNTVDAVVVQSGQVLLVTRGAHPGKGKLALPGGYINHRERLFNSCLRELKEETKIDLPPAVLRSSCKGHRIFDAPYRDPRGRFITTAFLFDLPKAPKLPAVKGSDDAAHAAWYDVARLNSQDLFADHHNIIRSMMRML